MPNASNEIIYRNIKNKKMKKFYVILIMFLIIHQANAQYVVIPDTSFASWLRAHVPAAMNGNLMDTTSIAVTSLTSMDVSDKAIADLSGIQYFSSLETLNCSSGYNGPFGPPPNILTSLPPLPHSLVTLNCENNSIASLPVLPNTLSDLNCIRNQLTVLPALPPSLKILWCSINQLSILPVLPDSLKQLYCDNNQITNIPVLPFSLKELCCYGNELNDLPSLPAALTTLYCGTNHISHLPVLPNTLDYLHCSHSYLTSLPVLPDTLRVITCGYNQLTALPALPPHISILECEFNQLTTLPALPSSLGSLACNNNQLTSLPALPINLISLQCGNNLIACFPSLPVSLNWSYLCSISGNPFTCLPNYVPTMDATTRAYPICVAGDSINNIYGCTDAGYGILGFTFEDMNSDCIRDNGDIGLTNIHAMLYDNNNNLIGQTFSATNGVYDFPSSIGTYTVKIDTSNVPFNVQCLHPGTDTSITISMSNMGVNNVNFSFNCKPGFDIGVQSMVINGFAFPGLQHTVKFVAGDLSHWYHMNCSAGKSGSVQLIINGPATFNGIIPGTLTPVVAGNVFTYNISDFGNINNNSAFGLVFTTDTTAQAGDMICIHISVNPVAGDNDTSNNSYNYCYSVVNSLDPNMKEVYPTNVLPDYRDYFTYTIHFQNTGNAPAANIRIVDTLSTDLDIETFQVTNYSHYNKTSLMNNVLTVKFPDIQLPDSSSNPEASKGYIQYRIKPKAGLALGDKIKNTAYIYFDYNSPVATNTTINEYTQASFIRDTKDNSSLIIYPNPAVDVVTIQNSRNSIETHIVIFDIRGKIIMENKFYNQNSMKMNISDLTTGIYLVKIQTDKKVETKKLLIR